jgi:hypothetical protein
VADGPVKSAYDLRPWSVGRGTLTFQAGAPGHPETLLVGAPCKLSGQGGLAHAGITFAKHNSTADCAAFCQPTLQIGELRPPAHEHVSIHSRHLATRGLKQVRHIAAVIDQSIQVQLGCSPTPASMR